ncbi:sigma-70 family RNA polymerase sigma factor [Stieleria varia]|uniref:RNA polymerase sigma factor n=1 Tax=Stieleria varia TaxID=2528005 RepID=A0A5C6BB67_9BACT|nr:sigma-70 family RNA polymerase sigma factor [Stieleria varia]TWU08506.1 RNA polymerase sigma factor [Stieleria varia]
MDADITSFEELLRLAKMGDEVAMAALFEMHRKRLRQMVQFRLDSRLKGRVDPSDVLQEAWIEARTRLPGFSEKEEMPFFLWLRLIVGQKLLDLRRHHIGVQMRTVDREIANGGIGIPGATSIALAAQLLGYANSPSDAAIQAETRRRIQEALDAMDPIDREVLTLRHFEFLTNAETAKTLKISHAAASNRYIRALQRMKQILSMAQGNTDDTLTRAPHG